MPASRSPVSRQPTAVAPDGIAIHTFDVPAAKLVGVAEGRVPPGRFAIHRHLTLEQYTYVVRGGVTAITSSHPNHDEKAVELSAGDLLLTGPGETLQFLNTGSETARLLFICAPPYPVDDSDTRLLDDHKPMASGEVEAAIQRLLEFRAAVTAEIDARLAHYQHLIASTPDSKAPSR
jgi:mannose-6-phosphate isomerase-like protein (cupin superfamily)